MTFYSVTPEVVKRKKPETTKFKRTNGQLSVECIDEWYKDLLLTAKKTQKHKG